MKQIDDPLNPCYGGVISNPGACWIRNADGTCFQVVSHNRGYYTLKNGRQQEIKVKTADLPELFKAT